MRKWIKEKLDAWAARRLSVSSSEIDSWHSNIATSGLCDGCGSPKDHRIIVMQMYKVRFQVCPTCAVVVANRMRQPAIVQDQIPRADSGTLKTQSAKESK